MAQTPPGRVELRQGTLDMADPAHLLTPAGKRQLVAEESKWRRLARAIGQVMSPAEEG